MRKLLLTLTTLMLIAGLVQAQETTITGFADAAYYYNTSDINGEFTVDQVEVDIIHQASEKTLVRADLEWIRDGEEHVAQVEQAFMTYTTGGPMLDVTFGKFNAPIGFEALDPVDMYQYSHSLLFDYGGPTNLVGVSVGRSYDSGLDWIGHMSNGWDAETMTGGNTTFGGRLGYAKNALGAHVSYIAGEEAPEAADPFKRSVFDIDAGYELEKILFGAQFNSGSVTDETATGDIDSSWLGFMVMTNLTLNDWLSFTFRFDMMDDGDGYHFGLVDDGSGNMVATTRNSLTFCPTFKLDQNFGCLVELRIDSSDQDAFTDSDGEATGSTTGIAFEATYSW